MSKYKGDYPRDCYPARGRRRRQPDPVQDAIVIDAILNGRPVTFPDRAEAARLFHKAKGLLDDRRTRMVSIEHSLSRSQSEREMAQNMRDEGRPNEADSYEASAAVLADLALEQARAALAEAVPDAR